MTAAAYYPPKRHVITPGPPGPATIIKGCDVSNYFSNPVLPYTGADLVRYGREQYGVMFAFVQGLPSAYDSTDRQCQAIIEDGITKLGGYVWLFPNGTRDGDLQRRLHRFDPYKSSLWRMALDLEDTTLSFQEAHDGLNMTKEYLPNRPLVCYSAKWYLDQMHWTQDMF